MSLHESTVERLTLSPTEVAAALGIGRVRVYQLLDDGTIPSFRLGRRRLIRREALVDILQRLEQSAGDDAA